VAAQLGLLDYLSVSGPDVAALVAFYRDVLDAGVIEEAYPDWARVRLANVDLGVRRGERALSEDGAGPCAAFRVQDLAGFRAHLERCGVEAGEYHDIAGGVTLDFRDPAGNVLRVIRWGRSAAEERSAATPGD
jgi:catechol 2,3-dioxygenase-like lactoylglutathione lyase family enzyme